MNIIKFKILLKKYMPRDVFNILKCIVDKFRKIIFTREIKKRENYSIFDYKLLAQDMSLYTKEYADNDFYGLAKIVKKVMNIPEDNCVDGCIEHGFNYDNDISDVYTAPSVIYAFGEKRKEFLKDLYPNKKIYCISPYIQYVKGIYSNKKLEELKSKFGKTLLAMPSHSTHYHTVNYNKKLFIKEIERIKQKYNFDTVLICLYWKDILQGEDIEYLKQDYIICTAGHLYDPNFLKRLKSIILLSDLVISNSIGTNLGYSIVLNKPYYLYYIKTTFNNACCTEENTYYQKITSLVIKLFGKYSEKITKEQIDFVKSYWGKWS